MISVAFTAAISIGTVIGKTRIERMVSLDLVAADMAEKSVPMVEKPSVPKKMMIPSGMRTGSRFRLNKIIKMARVNISIITVKINVPIIFARYIPQGLKGQRSNPGSVPLSLSTPKHRPSPISPAKINTTQRIPGTIVFRFITLVPSAKLKMIRTRKEKRHMDRIISLVLNSDNRSFQTMAHSFLINVMKTPAQAVVFSLCV